MDYFLRSHKHFAFGLFIATILITIPFSISIFRQQQFSQKTAQQQPQTTTSQSSPARIAASNSAGCTVADADFAQDADEQQLLALINQYRQQNNLPALTLSATLTSGAQWMADDMATSGNINTHTDSLGRDYAGRAAACGYPSAGTAVDIVAASSTNTPAAILTTWKNSPTHNPVILNSVSGITRTWQGIGIGKSNKGASPFTQRWVVMFGEANDGGAVPTVAVTPTPTTSVITATPTPSISPSITSPTTITQTQSNTLFNLVVKLIGIGNSDPGQNKTPVDGQLTGQIEIKKDENVVYNNSGPFKYDSQTSTFTATIPVLDAGTYRVKTRSNNSLWADLGFITIVKDQTTTSPTITLITGDLNQDNILDMQDYNIFVTCYGTKSCQQKQTADVNLDEKVNEIDLNIFYSGLANRRGD